MRKLVFYPEVVSFIEEEKDQFPTVKVQYVFNSPPKLIMLDDAGQHKETIRCGFFCLDYLYINTFLASCYWSLHWFGWHWLECNYFSKMLVFMCYQKAVVNSEIHDIILINICCRVLRMFKMTGIVIATFSYKVFQEWVKQYSLWHCSVTLTIPKLVDVYLYSVAVREKLFPLKWKNRMIAS